MVGVHPIARNQHIAYIDGVTGMSNMMTLKVAAVT
jgi:hypothetical protein